MENTIVKDKVNKKQEEMEELKSEILDGIKSKKNKKKLHWGSGVVTLVLVLLTFFSVVQTVQSAYILDKVNNEFIKASAGSPVPGETGIEYCPYARKQRNQARHRHAVKTVWYRKETAPCDPHL